MTARPRTLFEKIWESHIVRPQTADTPAVLYIDLHLVHEVTSPQAFTHFASVACQCAARSSHRDQWQNHGCAGIGIEQKNTETKEQRSSLCFVLL